MNESKKSNKINILSSFIKLKYLIPMGACFIFLAFILFSIFDLSIADDHTLTVYDFSSEGSKGPISRHKTYAIDESIHQERTGPSQIYSNVYIRNPKLPMFHPYTDWIYSESSRATGPITDDAIGIPQAPLILHISNEHIGNLPAPMLQRIRSTGVTDVIISVVAQNMPWQETTPILFRPHYGLFPDAPSRGKHNIYLPTTVGLFFSDNGNLSLSNTPVNELRDEELVLHPANHAAREPATVPDTLVLSGDVLHVQNLTHRTPQSVWSYVEYVDPASSSRTALATLHWLLDDRQTQALYNILESEKPGSMSEERLSHLFDAIEQEPTFAQRGGNMEKLRGLLKK